MGLTASTVLELLRIEFLKCIAPPPHTHQSRWSPQRPLCHRKEASAGGTAIFAATGEGGAGHARRGEGTPGSGSYLDGVRQRCSGVRCLRGGKVARSWRTEGL